MALKGEKNKAGSQEATPPPEASAPPEATEAPKPRKARTPKPPWGRTDEESYERDKVLAAVLRGDEALIKTAGSVTAALLKYPEFKDTELTPDMVAARVKSTVKAWEGRNAKLEAQGKTPKPVPGWLHLDAARSASVNLGAFDEAEDDE